MNIISEILHFLKYHKQRFFRDPRFRCTQRVKAFLINTPPPFLTEKERIQFLKFFRWHTISTFNYPYAAKYRFKKVKVYLDPQNGLHYVITKEQKRLYFKRNQSRSQISKNYISLCMEQDEHSPHYYCFNLPDISPNTVLADIGAADGNFSLKFIEKIKKLYLFECNPDWIEALEATFRPWKEKVEIINKYVLDDEEKEREQKKNNSISLDRFFDDKEKPTLVKMDVEGVEAKILAGARKLLAHKSISDLLICTYHRHGDEQKLTQILCENGYSVKPSEGYMLFLQEYSNPFSMENPIDFRRGIIHASK